MRTILNRVISKFKKTSEVKSAGEKLYELIRICPDKVKELFDLPQGYNIEFTERPSDDCIKFLVSNGQIRYKAVLNYGLFIGKDALYINDISRLSPLHSNCHVGSSILNGIANLATTFGFKFVGLNAVASNSVEDALNQEQLEAWYKRHLGNHIFDFDFYNNSEELCQKSFDYRK